MISLLRRCPWLLALGLPLTPFVAQAQVERTQAMLVLDASASMRARIGSETRMEVARRAAKAILQERPEGLELGLMVYGDQESDDCNDVGVRVEPGTHTTLEIARAVDEIEPRGKTPLHRAVLQAAEALQHEQRPGSVIVVSDGLDTCGGDLAELGRRLARDGVGLRVHVVGFALGEAESSPLRALASATNGFYSSAGDTGELKSALETAMSATVSRANGLLSLRAVDRTDGTALRGGVVFEVFRGRAKTPVQRVHGHEHVLQLEPGRYRVTARLGEQVEAGRVEVAPGKLATHAARFSGPTLSLRALRAEGGAPVKDGLVWEVLQHADGQSEPRRVALEFGAQPRLRLAPGRYTVTVKRGDARATASVHLGRAPEEVSLILDAGEVRLLALPVPGMQPLVGRVSWTVWGEPDAEGHRPKIASTSVARPTLSLPAGPYLAEAELAGVTTRAPFEVTAGKERRIEVVIGSGEVRPRAVMRPGLDPASGSLRWSVFAQPGPGAARREVDSSPANAPAFTLPSGRYEVRVERGVARGSVEVEVSAGQTVDVLIDLHAAVLRPRALLAKGSIEPSLADFSVLGALDTEGRRPVLDDARSKSAPTFYVPAGSHRLVAQVGSAKATIDVQVVAGELSTPTIVLQAGVIEPRMAGGGSVSWRVLGRRDSEGRRPVVDTSHLSRPRFVLPAGDYRIEAESSGSTARVELSLRPGELLEPILSAPKTP